MLDRCRTLASQGHCEHGYVEELLPQAIKLARVRERTEVLDACVIPEQVRRLCRRAGVSMHQTNDNARRKSSEQVSIHQTSAPDDEDTVSQALQKVCDLYLFNLCKEINRLCGHLHKKPLQKTSFARPSSPFTSSCLVLAGRACRSLDP